MPRKGMSAQELWDEAIALAKQRIDAGKPRAYQNPLINNVTREATVYLYDVIDSWWGIDAAEFVKDLNAIDADVIHLRINSPGGVTTDAEAIQVALQQHSARIVAHIDGLAASAATYIALAAEEIEISDGGLFMIHNAWTCSCGSAEDMRYVAELLDKIDANIVRDYMKRTGKDEDQIKQWMSDSTWFDAEEALENGFVDRIYTAAADDDGEDTNNKVQNSGSLFPFALAEASDDDPDEEEPDFDLAARALREREMQLIEIGA